MVKRHQQNGNPKVSLTYGGTLIAGKRPYMVNTLWVKLHLGVSVNKPVKYILYSYCTLKIRGLGCTIWTMA